ncbi:GH39 family glycosyl hydrolase [Leadbettera azotonutricia]|uniref:Glycosyl hydrolases family 39 N-terminal catalytic domain-containing protein n=1 Tax=Leadbettera azotonutricia (strain ATCC BAA-888 / DSM 13862 / ZAS-9) TaxID=545695 RepID=F5Y7A0_LEAAZ|nr:hypothetical protein [Leadbettera azotonutricia]AEF82706.1 hypothetical protein TREAZ_3535 [Leadbettera azotonutricia ZAS-9]
MRKLFLFLLPALLCLSACSDGTPEEEAYVTVSLDLNNAVLGSDTVSIPEDFVGIIHSGYSNDPDSEYALLNELGVEWVHQDFSWSSIEKADNQWTFGSFDAYVTRANAEGKKVLGMLLYDVGWIHTGKGEPDKYVSEDEIPLFCDYARETVKRYNGKNGHGKVDAWAIWNEPNLEDRFWKGTKAEFYALTKATAETIRALDAIEDTHTFLVGGLFNTLATPEWIDGIFTSGAMEKIDAIAYHPYTPNAFGAAGVYHGFKNQVAAHGFADKIWVNEIGYPTQGSYGTEVKESDMPEMVTKTMALLAADGAKTIFWYHLFDSQNRNPIDSEDWFGLVWKNGSDWQKKGGYDAFALCAHQFRGKESRTISFPGSNLPGFIKTCYFEGNDNSRILLVWNESVISTRNVKITLPGIDHKVWNLANGSSQDVGATNTVTLYPTDRSKQTVVFLTWQQP